MTTVGKPITAFTACIVPLSTDTSAVVTVETPLITTPLVVFINKLMLFPFGVAVDREFTEYPVSNEEDTALPLTT